MPLHSHAIISNASVDTLLLRGEMAQRTRIVFTDDLDGRKAAETVRFNLDGVEYEIDLSAANARTMRGRLAKYVKAGRKVKKTTTSGRRTRTRKTAAPAPSPRRSTPSSSVIREWAANNGYDVAPSGRLSTEVHTAYTASQN
jgi:hypothetical protein